MFVKQESTVKRLIKYYESISDKTKFNKISESGDLNAGPGKSFNIKNIFQRLTQKKLHVTFDRKMPSRRSFLGPITKTYVAWDIILEYYVTT